MNIKLRTHIEYSSPIEQILGSRGADWTFLNPQPIDELPTTDLVNIDIAAKHILKALVTKERVYVQVDSDCDGYTSAALLLNFMHDIAPTVVENNWSYGLHDAKTHGVDLTNIDKNIGLVIIPDASSNECDLHKKLNTEGIDCVVLDHHEFVLEDDEPAVIVNSQAGDYKNPALSGVGVVYKTLKRITELYSIEQDLDKYIDLLAVGLIGDMMDQRFNETNYYINKGLEDFNNPFLVYLSAKNDHPMKGKRTPHTISWYIVPFINAVTRVGSMADKLLVFESMLNWKACELITSDKKGDYNKQEMRVTQAVRHASNIKRHQDEEKKKLLDEMYEKIEKYNLLAEPVLIIQNKNIPDDDPIRGITGLVANVLMAEYTKPTLILNEITNQETGETIWSGSGRGFETETIDNWRDYIANTGCAIFAQGHAMAFGVAFTPEGLEQFKERVRKDFGTIKFDKTYVVDFVWTMNDMFDQTILDIGRYEDVWGQGVPEPLIAIEHVKIQDPVDINLLAKGTLRIDLKPHQTSIIKFGSDIDEYQQLLDKTITIIGRCKINDWGGVAKPQLELVDYLFETVSAWDF